MNKSIKTQPVSGLHGPDGEAERAGGFTPGPWRIGEVNANPEIGALGETAILAPAPGPLGFCCPAVALPFTEDRSGLAMALANARLIAAAPDLLDAAQRVMATKKAWDDYARIGMPARSLLEPPDRAEGNKAFTDLAAAIAKALTPEVPAMKLGSVLLVEEGGSAVADSGRTAQAPKSDSQSHSEGGRDVG